MSVITQSLLRTVEVDSSAPISITSGTSPFSVTACGGLPADVLPNMLVKTKRLPRSPDSTNVTTPDPFHCSPQTVPFFNVRTPLGSNVMFPTNGTPNSSYSGFTGSEKTVWKVIVALGNKASSSDLGTNQRTLSVSSLSTLNDPFPERVIVPYPRLRFTRAQLTTVDPLFGKYVVVVTFVNPLAPATNVAETGEVKTSETGLRNWRPVHTLRGCATTMQTMKTAMVAPHTLLCRVKKFANRVYFCSLTLKYSLTMILTTSGTVLILRALRSSSSPFTISSVMATVIFCVPVLLTRVRCHRKAYNAIGGILMRALGDIRWTPEPNSWRLAP